MAASAGKRGAPATSKGSSAANSNEELLRRLVAAEAEAGRLRDRLSAQEAAVKSLKEELQAILTAPSRVAGEQAAGDSVPIRDLQAAVTKTAKQVAEIAKRQEALEKANLSRTLLVHAYTKDGDGPPTAASVKAKLVAPASLQESAIVCCVRLGVGRGPDGTAGAGTAAEGGAEGEGSTVGTATGASPAAAPAAGASPSPVKRCFTFKVILADAEVAKLLLITRRGHKQAGSGLVIRQALTRRERALMQAFMPAFNAFKAAGDHVDFRSGRLYRRVGGHWQAEPLPKGWVTP